MEIIYFDLDKPIVLKEQITACIGYFDGLHKGHQKLIERVHTIASVTNTAPSLITFDPDPWVVLKQVKDIPHLTPMKHRMEIGEKLGIKYWIILKFKPEMAHLSYTDFHETVLAPLQLHTLVCGYDFHYANYGKGDIHTLQQQFLFQVDVVDEVSSEHRKISSSRIEECLRNGEVEKATSCMGRFYEVRGYVKEGNHMGGSVGFPTANMQLDEEYVIPKKGVYVGMVKVKNSWHKAMINIGHNPTFNFQEATSIEAHILDFHDMIYQEEIQFRFLAYLRGEKKFENKQAFKKELALNEREVRCYFEERKDILLCD